MATEEVLLFLLLFAAGFTVTETEPGLGEISPEVINN